MPDNLSGVGVALVTPFTGQKAIDYPALERVIEHCITGGVDFLVSLGTTGEAVTLSPAEKTEIVDFTKNTIDGRVPLVVGFGGNNTAKVIQNIKAQDFDGISAILSASPAYNKPTQQGIKAHYNALAEVAPVPIIIYNVPSRTASNVEAATTMELAKNNPQFIAVKEASGDIAQCMDIVQQAPKSFDVLSGDDLLTLPLIGSGFDGVISVIANAFPAPFVQMVKMALNNDLRSASEIHYQLKDLMQLIFAEGNPAGVKAVLHILGIAQPYVRLPLVEASKALTSRLETAVKALENAQVSAEI